MEIVTVLRWPQTKTFFQCSESSEQATVQPFNTKNSVELQNVQKEKGKENCDSPSSVKILYRLDPYENVSS